MSELQKSLFRFSLYRLSSGKVSHMDQDQLGRDLRLMRQLVRFFDLLGFGELLCASQWRAIHIRDLFQRRFSASTSCTTNNNCSRAYINTNNKNNVARLSNLPPPHLQPMGSLLSVWPSIARRVQARVNQ